jgi:transposase-like protein
LDEAFVKVNGKLCYLWRAIDHEGQVLEAVVTTKRDKAAALKLLKRVMKKYGRPRIIVTDRLRAYSAAMVEIGVRIGTRSVAVSTIAQRIRISRFGDANGRCSAFAKSRRFARTSWWWTQSLQTGLPSGEFPAIREKNREFSKNVCFEPNYRVK